MACENCGGQLRPNSERGCYTCVYCASDWVPESNVDGVRVLEPSDTNCPLCRVNLNQARLLEYALLYCSECRGMLVPMHDFVRLTDDLRARRDGPAYAGHPPDPRDLERVTCCPLCESKMDTHLYGGPGNIVMDTCERCEVHWLDQGELRRIVLAADHRYVLAREPSEGVG
jgi:Zn-finger nucleic acid-binding protein